MGIQRVGIHIPGDKLEEMKVEDLSMRELVVVLINRCIHTNGMSYVSKDQRDQILFFFTKGKP